MPPRFFDSSSILFFILVLASTPLNFVTSFSQSSPNTTLETPPAGTPSFSNASAAALFGSDLDALPDPSMITHHNSCLPPVPFEVDARGDCYVTVQWFLQNYPFDTNYTLTKRRIPGHRYMTVPKSFSYRGCRLTVDMVKGSPVMKAVGSSVDLWLWELYEECLPAGDLDKNGGGALAVDYLWYLDGELYHNEFKMRLRTREDPNPPPLPRSTSSASTRAIATAAAGVSIWDSPDVEIETS